MFDTFSRTVKDNVTQTSEIITYEADVQVIQKLDAEVTMKIYLLFYTSYFQEPWPFKYIMYVCFFLKGPNRRRKRTTVNHRA